MDTIRVSQFDLETANRIFVYRERLKEPREPHRHDFIEIGHVLEGVGTQVTSQGKCRVSAGDIIVMPTTSWHGFSEVDQLRIHYCCICPSVLRHELSDLMKDPLIRSFLLHGSTSQNGFCSFHLAPDEMDICRIHLDAIWNAAGGIGPDGSASALLSSRPVARFWKQLAHLTLLLTSLAEHYAEPPHACGTRMRDDILLQICDLFTTSPEKSWSLPELAKFACMEQSYLIRRFKEQIGISPMQYLYSVRMQRASELLTGTDKSIGEIGRESGFPEATHFSARFRKYFHLSPAQYRRKMQTMEMMRKREPDK